MRSEEVIEQIRQQVRQEEKQNLVKRLMVARRKKREKVGRCEGRKPFGAREGEEVTINKMADLRLSGMNYTHIADYLNRMKIPTRHHGMWFPATVSRILKKTK